MPTMNLPDTHKVAFSTLIHNTSLTSALTILDTGRIYGNDPDRHANFSCYRSRPDLARNNEISLIFAWKGEHKFAQRQGLVSPPDSENKGPQPNILYHLFTDLGPFHQAHNFEGCKYWQSQIYPGSTDTTLLQFIGFKFLDGYLSHSKPQGCIKRVYSKKARDEHQNYLHLTETVKKLNEHIGAFIKVPPENDLPPLF